MVAVTKFPKNPTQDQLYVDLNGVEWRFDIIRSRWVQQSLFENIPVVSASQDGLITPEIYDRLEQLKISAEQLDLSTFKIFPGIDAYYYYFYSPDGLIDIRHRGDGIISIDVNEQKLVAYLYRYLCIGDRGIQGDKGIVGNPGLPAPNEPTFYPDRAENVISGEVYVPIPIGTYYDHPTITPISLRFYGLYTVPTSFTLGDQLAYWINVIGNPLSQPEEKAVFSRFRQRIIDQSLGLSTGPVVDLSNTVNNVLQLNPGAILELDINPVDGSFTIVNNGINANAANIQVEFDRNLGYLKFSIAAAWPDDVVFKCRQRGPKGDRGDIPNSFISQFDCAFPDNSNVRPDTALIHFRLDCENDTFYVAFDRLNSQDAYQLVSTDVQAATTATRPIIEGRYAAVERVAGPVKMTALLINQFGDIDIDEPDLQDWEPQPGCHTKRSFANHEFDWISGTDIGECADELKWYGPEGVRPGKYPYELVRPSEPPGDQCCQDDYFIFPETGDC